jgi:P-type E1-E2 ATPase
MGALSYEDALSEDAAGDIEELKNAGVEKTIMFTPDKGDSAKAQFEASGADEYIAELTPFKRAEAISKIKEEEGVTCAYVGEALGCEQAIEEADVGISLAGKDSNGLEYTKVTLFGKLKTLADAIEAARLSGNKLEIHLYCASAAKIVTVLLGLFGVLNVAAALIIDAVLMIAALISAKEILK